MLTTLLAIAVLTQPVPEPVTTTGYCWHSPCVNAKAAKGITASGTRVQMGVCAANWAVFPKGSMWFIPGYGLCRVEDTGRLVQHRHLDLFFWDIQDARHWGRKTQYIRRVTMHETQDTIGKWATEQFGTPTQLSVLRRMCDEVLEGMELCVADNDVTRAMFHEIRNTMGELDWHEFTQAALDPVRRFKIAEELADATIVGHHAAHSMHVTLQDFVNHKMDINRRRKWKVNADKTGQHVDEDVVLAGIDQEEDTLP